MQALPTIQDLVSWSCTGFAGGIIIIWQSMLQLFNLIIHRADFLVASDLALRAQLTEFRDHHLVSFFCLKLVPNLQMVANQFLCLTFPQGAE